MRPRFTLFLALLWLTHSITCAADHRILTPIKAGSSTITPTTYGTPVFWTDAQNAASMGNPANNAKISSWSNLGSGSMSWSQSTSTNQPTYVTSSITHSKPGVHCDGSTSWMDGGTTAIFNTAQSFTAIFVFGAGSTFAGTDWQNIVTIATSGTEGLVWETNHSAAGYAPLFWGSKTAWAQGVISSPANWTGVPYGVIYEISYNGSGATSNANFTLYWNGTLTTINAAGTFGSSVANQSSLCTELPGGTPTGFAGMDWNEIIIYKPAISSANQTTLRNSYVKPRWGF